MNDKRDSFYTRWVEQRQGGNGIHLSIVIPAYNEERRLPPTLLEIIDFLGKDQKSFEVIVVNDGSTDTTAQVVLSFAEIAPQIRLHSLEQNSGKGAATRAGILQAKGDYILFTDADGSTPIAELVRLQEALSEGADVAIGSRALSSQETEVRTSFHRKALGRLFNWSMNALILPGISDTQCGFKLFRSKPARFIFSRQQTTGFSFDLEILFIARKVGLKIAEVPVNWQNVEGSKVNLLQDALRMFRDAFRIRKWHSQLSNADYNDCS